MNKFRERVVTILIAILGACNKVMSVFIPIGLALVLIAVYPAIAVSNSGILIGIATLSSLFRAISIWID